MKAVKVGFLSSHNYLDKNAFSGTLYSMRRALGERHLEVIDLGNPRKPSRWRRLLNRVWKNDKASKIGSTHFVAEYTKFASKIKKQLRKTPCDIIFAPVAKRELSFIETTIPVISLSDVTFNLLKKKLSIRFR